MAGRSHVMMGSLSNFSLREVLDVVALSRQHTVVELRGNDGSNLASINVKGGHLVQGEPAETDPRESLVLAMQAPAWCTFHVFRVDDIDNYRSFGTLVDLLGDQTPAADPVRHAPAGAADADAPPSEPVAANAASIFEPPRTWVAAEPTDEPPRVPVAVEPDGPPSAPMAARPVDERPAAYEPPPAPVAIESIFNPPPASAVPVAVGVSVAVASPKGGVGKTTIALNLAISLAHRSLRVILIDADVNGDLLSLINSRGSAEVGTYDLLDGSVTLERALRRTVVPGLQILPAAGRALPASALFSVDRSAKWRGLIGEATGLADVVLVDCPAGMAHSALEILQSVSHVLGVFQAEPVASRSFEMFERGLAALGDRYRPEVAGVVVNMLREDAASSRAYRDLVAGDTARRVLKTTITRSEAFDEAAAAAKPVRLHGGAASRTVASCFDDLASELVLRLPVAQPPADGSFML